MKALLLATKLQVPRLPVQHVPRGRLVDLVERGAAGALTLVSAPAGFGKTTLLAEWARATSLPVAWLALESADSEPARLLAYIQAALQTLDERVGQAGIDVPEMAVAADYERVLAMLINDVARYLPGDVALVLDDYHVLEHEAAHTILSFLLEHMPEHLHLVLGTRVDPPLPLARLRARGQLCELHAEILRFAEAEMEKFARAMQLELGVGALRSLEERTEGWIAGVQLAVLGLRGHSDPEAFLNGFRGNHRFILEYVSEEILARQTPRVRSFLLRTSILERLNGSLCDAVTEQVGSQALLESLRRDNLFVSALDDTGEWYRYHALFAEGLRHHLMQQEPELVADLYGRASRWFEAREMLYEACEAALQAKDFTRAVPLMERLVNRLIGRVEFSVLRRWLALVPEEIVASRPILKVAATWISLASEDNHIESLDQVIDSLQQNFQEQADATDQTEWAEAYANLNFIRIMRALGNKNTEVALELARQTLQELPVEATYMRAITELCLQLAQATEFRLNGDFVAAERVLSEISTRTNLADFHFLNLVIVVSLIEMYEARGELPRIARLYQKLAQMLRGQKETMAEMSVWIASGYAKLFLEWNRLDEAEEYIQMAQVANRGLKVPELTFIYRFIQLGIKQARGQMQEARDLLRELEEDTAALASQAWNELLRPVQARHLLRQGQVDEAWLRFADSDVKYTDILADPPDETLFTKYVTLARLLIAQARKYSAGPYLAQALELLEHLRAVYDQEGFTGRLLEVLMLTSLAFQVQGETARALDTLGQAVALAEPGGFIRLFVDEGEPMARLLARLLAHRPAHASYIRNLLAVLMPDGVLEQPDTPRSYLQISASSLLPEPLSAREMEVLALLATGSSNQEIAERLVIAPNTAKRHVKNILGKLDANNRTQAVARAREVGLLKHT